MKRTKKINLKRMRKEGASLTSYAIKPAALSVAVAGLVGCSGGRDAYIYETVTQCVNDHPSKFGSCETAYMQALNRSRINGKKYTDINACEKVYGDNSCERYLNSYVPLMTGFMFSPYHSRGYYPVYSSTYRHSPYYNRWGTIDGSYYPKTSGSSVSKSNRKVALTKKTMSRGGFGSTVSAKSSWGGSSSRGGWGG